MELKATIREVLGKKVKELRKTGAMPAEFFGRGLKNKHLTLSHKEFAKIYKAAGEHELVTLKVGVETPIQTLITSAQRDAISGVFLSADFYAVRMDEKLTVNIPIEFVGEAPAEKNGFPIIKVLDEVEIETLPANMPHKFTVDLSVLNELGKTIYIKDIKVPKGVEILLEEDAVIATVGEKTAEEVAPPAPDTDVAPVEGAEKEKSE
ncbi:MAG: 50S ribosomal protein L25 [Candidatus Jorgensenbacteria bacterium]|nr:50S ribosomal protein L25 [Candidatus Jorgensenbacteria bacterium]